jgi:acetyl-CoA synthetase
MDLFVVDPRGRECPANRGGLLALRQPVPALALELRDSRFPLALGVQARMDRAGTLWTMGEIALESSAEAGPSLPELEARIGGLPGVEQVAVVRFQDPCGSLRTLAFVRRTPTAPSLEALRQQLQERFGERSVPDSFQQVQALPVSRNGKLLRSVLQRIASGDIEGLAEMDLAADPAVVRELILGQRGKT